MGTRFRFLPGLLVPVFLLGLNACKTSSSSTSSSTGALFVSTQGDSLVSAYTIDLSTGVLTANGAGVATGCPPPFRCQPGAAGRSGLRHHFGLLDSERQSY